MSLQPCLCKEPHNPTEYNGQFWCQDCGGTVDVSRDGNAGPDVPAEVDVTPVPGVVVDAVNPNPVVSTPAFQPADEPLEIPEDPKTDPSYRGAVRRGTEDPKDLPKTHRMLIGIAHKGLAARSMSNAELAKITGLSSPFISQLLSGRRLGTMETWDKILDVVHFDYMGLGRFRPPVKVEAKSGKRRGRKTTRTSKPVSFDEL